MGTNSAFALGPKKTTENLDRSGWSQDLPDANWLVAISPALNTQALTLVPIWATALIQKTFTVYFTEFFLLCANDLDKQHTVYNTCSLHSLVSDCTESMSPIVLLLLTLICCLWTTRLFDDLMVCLLCHCLAKDNVSSWITCLLKLFGNNMWVTDKTVEGICGSLPREPPTSYQIRYRSNRVVTSIPSS
jgi:hypothetical protein